MVMNLVEGTEGVGRHLYMDNYYTSIPLFSRLLDVSIRATGTIRKNRKNLPEDFKNLQLLRGQSKFYCKKSLMALAWQDKK